MENLMNEFIKRISWNYSMNMEYCRDCNANKKENDYNKLIKRFYDYKNLHFTSWIKDPTKNRSIENISQVNRISIDIDFRKAYKKKFNEEISDEDIETLAKQLWEYLKEEFPLDFWQWNFIVFSWNWIHIHYIWNIYTIKNTEEANLYRDVCLDFYNKFNTNMWDELYFADTQVWSIWHLFRLPWTINEKDNKQHNCKIVAYQDIDSNVVNNLSSLFKYAYKRKIKLEEELLQKIREKEKRDIKYNKWDNINVFEWCNNNIPISNVIQILIPERRLKQDWKNFYDPTKWRTVNASYFIVPSKNILIRNWSTKLPWMQEWFNVISLVMEWFWYRWRDALEWLVSNWLANSSILDKDFKWF